MRKTAAPYRTTGTSQLSGAWLLALVLAVALGLCMQGCASRAPLANRAQPPAAPDPAGPGLALPLPSQLRTVSDTQSIAKLGREYETLLPHNLVAVEVDNARYSPDWAVGGGITGAAYAIYEFGLTDYTGEQSLSLTWVETGSFANAWLGLANFAHNRWEWFAMPAAAGNVSRLAIAFADYIQPGGGRMLVVPVFIDPAPATWLLSEVRVGAVPGQPWLHTWGGASDDAAYDAATDAAGNLYLTGYTESFGSGSSDLLLLKYSPDGALLWQKTWGTDKYEEGAAIAVDSSGEIYIAGSAEISGPKYGVLILRLSSSGLLEWQKFYSMVDWSPDGKSIAVDSSGNVFILGHVATVDIIDEVYVNQDDAVVFELNPDGTMPWDSAWGGYHSDHFESIVPDDAGGCYASGWFSDLYGGIAKVAALKFSINGSIEWAKSWSYGFHAATHDIARASDGTLWFCGETQLTSVTDQQALLLSLSPAGKYFSGSIAGGYYGDYFNSIAVAADGTIHACGGTSTQPSPSNPNAFYAVVNSGGLVIAKAWGSSGIDEYFNSVTLDGNNAAFLGGLGKTPTAGSWTDIAASYASAPGITIEEGTERKTLHGALSNITGTLQDVDGVQDAETGDDTNVLACKP